jgi:hypothetical protein
MFSKTVENSSEVLNFIKEFNSDLGTVLVTGIEIVLNYLNSGKTINIKSFKVPHLINKIVYKKIQEIESVVLMNMQPFYWIKE